MYPFAHPAPGYDFGKGRAWMCLCKMRGKTEKKTLGFLGELPDETAEIQEALWLRERERVSTTGRSRRPSGKGWVFLLQAHFFPRILSPWKLLTGLWQGLILPLPDKLSPILYLTQSCAGGAGWGCVLYKGSCDSVLGRPLPGAQPPLPSPYPTPLFPRPSLSGWWGTWAERKDAGSRRGVWEKRKQAAKPGNSSQFEKEVSWL